jgi:nucleotide-binding universal stress UspA family protein
MSPSKTILYAAAFSERAHEAFRLACLLAHESGARIVILHVVESARNEPTRVNHCQPILPFVIEQTGAAGMAMAPSGLAVSVKDHLNQLARLKERLGQHYRPSGPIDVEFRTEAGEPAEKILRTALELKCDLIVMGTHGRGGVPRMLMGSVAEAVARAAPCPVLTLRTPDPGNTTRERIETILVSTDFDESSALAARIGSVLARQLGARLVLLHVVPMDVLGPGEVPLPIDLDRYHASLEALRSELSRAAPAFPVEVRLGRGDVAAEILKTAESVGCDLIVMSTHGRSGVSRVLMGSQAEAVSRRSNCPVLTIKPHTHAGLWEAETGTPPPEVPALDQPTPNP